MSTFSCPVVKLEKFGKNPNSDTLCIWNGPQGPVQFKEGQFNEGDVACFIPADSIVHLDRSEFSFLRPDSGQGELFRLRGVRLRGVPSVGILLRVDGISCVLGQDLSEHFGVKKYEPPQTHSFFTHSEQAVAPSGISDQHYDVENLWHFENGKLMNVAPGEEASVMDWVSDWDISEKIHGCNFRAVMTIDGQIHIGSRSRWVKETAGNVWWEAFNRHRKLMEDLLGHFKGHVFYGEVYGKTQDLHYSEAGVNLRLFDMMNGASGVYESARSFECSLIPAGSSGLLVPKLAFLQHTTFREAIETAKGMVSAPSRIDGKELREGVVLRPYSSEQIVISPKGYTRLLTKVINPAYLSRANGTEHQ